jgi:hypothetical protein
VDEGDDFDKRVGEAEPCDWCGRSGTVRQHDYYEDGTLVCRNPSLCDVCGVLFDASGEVADAFYAMGIDFVGQVEDPMEEVFAAKWRDKVAAGLRKAAR